MADEIADIMDMESGVPAGLATPEKGGRENAEAIHKIVEMGFQSLAREVIDSTKSNVMEIVS